MSIRMHGRRLAAAAGLALVAGLLVIPATASAATPEATPVSITFRPSVITPVDTGAATILVSDISTVDRTLNITVSDTSVLPFIPPTAVVDAGSQAAGILVLANAVTQTKLVTITATGNGVTVSAVLTVNPEGTPPPPPTISTFTINPQTVVAGNPSTGTVTLPHPAPAGGLTIFVDSRLPSMATAPASIVVPAGATTASFPITTFTNGDASILFEVINGDTIIGTGLNVLPIDPGPHTVVSLTLPPSSVVAGSTVRATLTVLTGGVVSPAPAGGIVVTLTSSNAAATVPASVTIPAGASGRTFSIVTHAVTATTSAVISATFNGTASPTLTITPAPAGGGTGTLSVTATGRSGVTVSSNPAGIHVAVGGAQVATFTLATSITLSASDGRDVIWSGACSSAGKKLKTCTFTFSGGASETANVQ